mmetsp:Transcript_56779/g.182402  ORF Transcript_56779/g.182402 Transcript_56779/m.182402 type:complete len:336 (+) Transcript_56779:286-1293(+)
MPGDGQVAPPPDGAGLDLVVAVEGLAEALEAVAQGAAGLHGAARLPAVVAGRALDLQEVPEDGLVVVQGDDLGVLPEVELEEVLVRLPPGGVRGRGLCAQVAEGRVPLRALRRPQHLPDDGLQEGRGAEVAPGVEVLGVRGRRRVARLVLAGAEVRAAPAAEALRGEDRAARAQRLVAPDHEQRGRLPGWPPSELRVRGQELLEAVEEHVRAVAHEVEALAPLHPGARREEARVEPEPHVHALPLHVLADVVHRQRRGRAENVVDREVHDAQEAAPADAREHLHAGPPRVARVKGRERGRLVPGLRGSQGLLQEGARGHGGLLDGHEPQGHEAES